MVVAVGESDQEKGEKCSEKSAQNWTCGVLRREMSNDKKVRRGAHFLRTFFSSYLLILATFASQRIALVLPASFAFSHLILIMLYFGLFCSSSQKLH